MLKGGMEGLMKQAQEMQGKFQEMQDKIDSSYSGKSTMTNFAMGALVAGAATFLAMKFAK